MPIIYLLFSFIIGLANQQTSPTALEYLYNRELMIIPGELYLRLQESEKLVTKSIPKLKVNLVQAQQDNTWQLSTWGVLGISPKGSFFNYLRGLYSDSEQISLAMNYIVNQVYASNDLLGYLVQVIVNPDKTNHYKDENLIGPFAIPAGDDYWSVSGAVSLGDSPFSYTNQKICLSTIGNELFGVIDSLVWCDQVRKMVCNGETKTCTKDKAELDKAPVIKFAFEKSSVEFTHEDYVYFDEGNLQCRFGDICDQRSEGVCAQDTEVVLGKMFFEKYTPMFSLDVATAATSVSFIKEFHGHNKKVKVWGYVVFVLAIIVIILLIVFVIKKKRERADDPLYEVILSQNNEQN